MMRTVADVTSSPQSPDAAVIAGLSRADALASLGSDESGLSSAESNRRLDEQGANVFSDAPPRRLVRHFLANFGHLMALLLWVAGGIAFVARLPQLGIAIWVVNVVNGVFSFYQEYRAEQATAALRGLLPVFSTVLRDGVRARVPAGDLVVGDVLILEEGDRISADARVLDQRGLRVDQSTLTGESAPVRRGSEATAAVDKPPAEIPNLVLAGTNVAAGKGRAVVYATAGRTQLGRVASLTQQVEEAPSPLQLEMRRLSVIVSIVAVGVGVALLAIAITLGGLEPGRGFIFGLGIIVAFVPEGLLPTVTLSLAMGTQRMARRNALVKKLSAVETLGSTSVICTDKTGTLTQNEMTVLAAVTGDVEYRFGGVGYRPEGEIVPAADDLLLAMLDAAAAACNARVFRDDRGRWVCVGDPTEAAVVTAAMKAGVCGPWDRAVELPFDSSRRRMSTVDRTAGGHMVHVKGAPDAILGVAASVVTRDGVVALTPELRVLVDAEIDHLSAAGLRVLGVARRTLPTGPGGLADDEIETDLEFLGLLGMHDPPRSEVAEAVATCKGAGIRIIMITGDSGVTASVIGRRIGMVGDSVRVIDGTELDTMTDSDLAEALDTEVLFARSTPEHKLRVVTALRDAGHVVAVTGDGVNDAPALKRADIGVAMGLSGTDVAKEAADMILLDDNFASIVAAIEEGRAVFANIKRFTTYILTSNTPEAIPFIVFVFSGGSIPLALDVMHILAIDLGTDLAPALALGAEPPDTTVMAKPPRRADEHVIDRPLLTRAYVWLGPAQAAFVMVAFFVAYRLLGITDLSALPGEGPTYRAAAAMALAAVVATQIGNLFAQRSGGWKVGANRLIWWGIASELVVIAAIVWIPWLGRFVGTGPFPAVGWLFLVLGIPLLPIADALRRRLTERRSK
ncbi:MAG: cation-transporting P-type ATPase [Acidimicrobiia bacterium]|nr:cation-transporting P-type ATPase [Acidimicrobiia bacterium]